MGTKITNTNDVLGSARPGPAGNHLEPLILLLGESDPHEDGLWEIEM